MEVAGYAEKSQNTWRNILNTEIFSVITVITWNLQAKEDVGDQGIVRAFGT
jgi:hypothetical protein